MLCSQCVLVGHMVLVGMHFPCVHNGNTQKLAILLLQIFIYFSIYHPKMLAKIKSNVTE